MALNCRESFIITLPSSWYDLDNVEFDIKHQIIIVYTDQTALQEEGENGGRIWSGKKGTICKNPKYWDRQPKQTV